VQLIMVWLEVLVIFCILSLDGVISAVGDQPNIVFVLADDVGWADVSWNNPRLRNLTTNLEELSSSGTTLSSLYTLPVCTPSRAALLTGIYPFRYGLQRGFGSFTPNGLPTGLKLLPRYLKESGYRTHMLGKWHLGHCDTRYTPRYRGFDTFFGSYSGAVDHWTRMGGKKQGYDLRNGTDVSDFGKGLYSSELYSKLAGDIITKTREPYFLYVSLNMVHAPFQDVFWKNSEPAPPSQYIRNGMILAMDKAVGEIAEAIDRSDSAENTILIFMSDNGGKNFPQISPNLPLKGEKGELYEGGTHVPGFVRGSGLAAGTKYSGLMHIVDWVPTLMRLAGGPVPEGLDGLDQVEAIWKGADSPRNDMVYNIDEGGLVGHTGKQKAKWQIGIRKGAFKLIMGSPKMLKRDHKDKVSDNLHAMEFYNIESDISEQNNVIDDENSIEILEDLRQWSIQLVKEMVPVNFAEASAFGFPENLGGTIGSGWCRAVRYNWCSGDPTVADLLTWTAKPAQFRNAENVHLYTTGKAFLYNSPFLKNETKACFVKLENGKEIDQLLIS